MTEGEGGLVTLVILQQYHEVHAGCNTNIICSFLQRWLYLASLLSRAM